MRHHLNLKTASGKQIRFHNGSTNIWNFDGSGHFMAATDNTYDIGAGGATRPRSGYFGTSIVTPTGTFSTAVAGGMISRSAGTFSGDVEVTNSAKGVIIKSPDGTRWRITVSNAGVLSATAA